MSCTYSNNYKFRKSLKYCAAYMYSHVHVCSQANDQLLVLQLIHYKTITIQ